MTIGERIKEARLRKGLTQAELAKLLGYKSRSSINKIEVEGRDIPRSSIVKFAEILGVSPSYLMGWDEIEETIDFVESITDPDKTSQQVREFQFILGITKITEISLHLTQIRYFSEHHIA